VIKSVNWVVATGELKSTDDKWVVMLELSCLYKQKQKMDEWANVISYISRFW
jgi:hypothetical protein